jgi:glycosyltransferase involved in cell wall biosynthesis
MLNGRRIAVVMPGYNAEQTVRQTYEEIPREVVDDVLLVDDGSQDRTAAIARELGVHTLVHTENRGYGANQKTCYREALRRGADIVVMLHPDYQYTPKLIPALAACIASGLYDVALGSRILGGQALAGGMPFYKYFSNRVLTAVENLMLDQRLSEYHTGYRAFSRPVLTTLPLEENDDGFVFDNQMLVQAIHFGFGIAEVTCPTRYEAVSSSIPFGKSVVYGLGVLKAAAQLWATRKGAPAPRFLSPHGRRLDVGNP